MSSSSKRLQVETVLKIGSCMLFALSLLSTLLLLLHFDASLLVIYSSLLGVALVLGVLLIRVYRHLTEPVFRLSNLLEALSEDDFSTRVDPDRYAGAYCDVFKELSILSDKLSEKKAMYQGQWFLMLQLIEKMDTPVAIFDQGHRLKHGNTALSGYCGAPWQHVLGREADVIGLKYDKQRAWCWPDRSTHSGWEIRHNAMSLDGEDIDVVMLINIEKSLRKKQVESWKDIVRVLSHEIKNSLTPIKSLTQSLIDSGTQDDMSKKLLKVVVDRSDGLQDFVKRFSSLTKEIKPKPELVNVEDTISRVCKLFALNHFEVEIKVKSLFADPTLLEQSLINIVKNAVESGHDPKVPISITTMSNEGAVVICVADQGSGVDSTDNLFVPFYTTKSDGQGIGLALCQKILEHHNGRLNLHNNPTGPGVSVRMIFPNKMEA